MRIGGDAAAVVATGLVVDVAKDEHISVARRDDVHLLTGVSHDLRRPLASMFIEDGAGRWDVERDDKEWLKVRDVETHSQHALFKGVQNSDACVRADNEPNSPVCKAAVVAGAVIRAEYPNPLVARALSLQEHAGVVMQIQFLKS
jgi:hypothetical protein